MIILHKHTYLFCKKVSNILHLQSVTLNNGYRWSYNVHMLWGSLLLFKFVIHDLLCSVLWGVLELSINVYTWVMCMQSYQLNFMIDGVNDCFGSHICPIFTHFPIYYYHIITRMQNLYANDMWGVVFHKSKYIFFK